MIHYYQRLGISPGASASEVKRAYRTLARRYHPDVNASVEARQLFLDITEAYHYVLNDRQIPASEPVADTIAYEQLYQRHQYRRKHTPPPPEESAPSVTPVPPLVHFMMTGLVWGMSLFFILIPFYVCYQLINKGVNGWPSVAFFPLVIGGVCGVYQSARSGKRLLR